MLTFLVFEKTIYSLSGGGAVRTVHIAKSRYKLGFLRPHWQIFSGSVGQLTFIGTTTVPRWGGDLIVKQSRINY